MGKKDKSKKGKGAEKTIAKTLKKQSNKLKKELAAKGEVTCSCRIIQSYPFKGTINLCILVSFIRKI